MNYKKFLSKAIMIVITLFLVPFPRLVRAQPPIKLGFVGSISGMTSDMDVHARDGVLYAVEQVNESGGILGRKVELIIKDDKGNKKIAQKVDVELIEQGVVALIGHTTSSMTMAGKSIADRYKKVLISPTAASYQLYGKKDYVVCVNSSLREETVRLAKVVGNKLGIKKVACFYDVGNPNYSECYLKWFTHFYEKFGGKVVRTVAFNSKNMSAFWDMVSHINVGDEKGILIIAAPLHSAILTQKLRKIRKALDIFGVSWSLTSTFLKEGGKAIEGVWFCSDFDPQCKKVSYLNFCKDYRQHYAQEPDLISMLGFETVLVLKHALEKNNGSSRNLLKFIPGKYNGVQGRFVINENGDTFRDWFLLRVKNGKFTTLMKVVN